MHGELEGDGSMRQDEKEMDQDSKSFGRETKSQTEIRRECKRTSDSDRNTDSENVRKEVVESRNVLDVSSQKDVLSIEKSSNFHPKSDVIPSQPQENDAPIIPSDSTSKLRLPGLGLSQSQTQTQSQVPTFLSGSKSPSSLSERNESFSAPIFSPKPQSIDDLPGLGISQIESQDKDSEVADEQPESSTLLVSPCTPLATSAMSSVGLQTDDPVTTLGVSASQSTQQSHRVCILSPKI